MNVKIEISGLEDLMSDVEKANNLLAELGQLLNGIRAKYISVTANAAMTETESKDIDINT